MPCDSITTSQIDIGKLDRDLAAKAIHALGLAGTVSYSNGKLTVQGNQDLNKLTTQVRRAYGAEVVKSQAAKYGWTLKQTGQFQYEITKR